MLCTDSPSPPPLHRSILGCSTALGVVSVLLIISLVGHVVYTVVVCVLVRMLRKEKHSNNEKYITKTNNCFVFLFQLVFCCEEFQRIIMNNLQFLLSKSHLYTLLYKM